MVFSGIEYTCIYDASNASKLSMDEAKDMLVSFKKNSSEEFCNFIDYLIECKPIDSASEELGIEEHTIRAWLDDIIGTFIGLADKKNEEKKKLPSRSSNLRASGSTSGFDIYKYANETNADYYDFHTGYTYLVQEYNRAKSFGLPTLGIRVFCDGEFVGYAIQQ